MSAAPLLFLAAFTLVLASGCFYDFNIAAQTACPVSGECAEGYSCLGGECVESSRAHCTRFDRRCVGGVAWTCVADGAEQGEDCAAQGKACAFGRCLARCGAADAGAGCGAGEVCQDELDVCVPILSCASDSQCDATRAEGCFGGVCVARPVTGVQDRLLACYSTTSGLPDFPFDGALKKFSGPGTAGAGTLLEGAAPTAFTAAADGSFTTGTMVWGGTDLKVRFAGPTLAAGLHYGPLFRGIDGEALFLLAPTAEELGTLAGSEQVDDENGPGYEVPAGSGILVGRVRDCDGALLKGATVGYSVPVGRAGYLGAGLQYRAKKESSTVGGFVAFDLPVEVSFKVVVVALQQAASGPVPAVVWQETVRVDAPEGGQRWGLTSIDAGRGARR